MKWHWVREKPRVSERSWKRDQKALVRQGIEATRSDYRGSRPIAHYWVARSRAIEAVFGSICGRVWEAVRNLHTQTKGTPGHVLPWQGSIELTYRGESTLAKALKLLQTVKGEDGGGGTG